MDFYDEFELPPLSIRSRSTQRQTRHPTEQKPYLVRREEPRLAAARPKAGAQRAQRAETRAALRDEEVPATPSTNAGEDDDRQSQIEAPSRRRGAAPTHEELPRLSPVDSDDFEYFDVGILQQTQPAQAAPTSTTQRGRVPPSVDDKVSEASPPSSHASSDKENVPPPTAAARARAGQRPTARTRAGVLGALEEDQPTHSTPISTKRKAETESYLDGEFLNKATRQEDSPGVARRAQPLPQATQQLLDYQDRGVNKVMAWKAAGHDEAPMAPHDSPHSARGGDSIASWPTEDEPGAAADEPGLQYDVEDDNDDMMDEFGFFTADHQLRARGTHAYADSSIGGSEPAEDDDSHVVVELPINTTSDDRRLAEQAFRDMSSPVGRRHVASSPTAEPSSIILMPEPQANKPEEEAPTSKRVTRGSKQRKVDEAAAAAIEAADLERYSPSPEPSPRKRSTRAAKGKTSTSGIPLKRNEKKEQAILDKLAADPSSSPANSSAPSSPQANRTTKRGTPATKKLRMDDLIGLLPPRKRSATSTSTKAKASGSTKKKTTAAASMTTRRGKAGRSARASSSKAAGRGKGKKAKDESEEDDDDDDDDKVDDGDDYSFEQLTSVRPKRKARKRRARDEPDSSDEDDWRAAITSSQVHSDDSERTRRLKEFRAAEKYQMEYEDVL